MSPYDEEYYLELIRQIEDSSYQIGVHDSFQTSNSYVDSFSTENDVANNDASYIESGHAIAPIDEGHENTPINTVNSGD